MICNFKILNKIFYFLFIEIIWSYESILRPCNLYCEAAKVSCFVNLSFYEFDFSCAWFSYVACTIYFLCRLLWCRLSSWGCRNSFDHFTSLLFFLKHFKRKLIIIIKEEYFLSYVNSSLDLLILPVPWIKNIWEKFILVVHQMLHEINSHCWSWFFWTYGRCSFSTCKDLIMLAVFHYLLWFEFRQSHFICSLGSSFSLDSLLWLFLRSYSATLINWERGDIW